MFGVARDFAAIAGVPLRLPLVTAAAASAPDKRAVTIAEPDACGRYFGRVVRGLDPAAKTPQWMARRLERAGLRAISPLVDITNYVMLERGQPLHAFDNAKLAGAIGVRFMKPGERVKLLNEQEVDYRPRLLAITDDSGPIGLGGIMGGESTKADEATRNVFLESAFFFPDAVAGRARRYNFASDASHRFERGVDFDNNVDGIERATRLILDICGGEPGPTGDLVKKLPKRKPVRMRVARAQKVLGIAVTQKEMASVFKRLSLPFSFKAGAFTVKPPSYRFDIGIEEDLIEEVARIHGFERIAAHPPRAAATMLGAPEAVRGLHALRERLAGADYHEVINFTFVEPQWENDFGSPGFAGEHSPIRLLNPINSQQSVMRTTLLGSLISNVRYNQARKVPRIRVFEIGRVFLRDPAVRDGPLSVAGVRQPTRIAAAAYGPALEEQWGSKTRTVDFFDVKADLEALAAPLALRCEPAEHPAFHPGRSARLLVSGKAAGWLGELHPRWQRKYELAQPAVLCELDAEPLLSVPMPRFEPPSRYPAVVRDLSLLFPAATPVQAVLDAIQAEKPPIVRTVRVFDLYQGTDLPAGGGSGSKSLAFRVVMQHTERTLTDAEADAARDELVALLGRKFSAILRT